MAEMREIPKTLPIKVTNKVLPNIKSPKVPVMTGKFERRSFGSIDIPTWKVTKITFHQLYRLKLACSESQKSQGTHSLLLKILIRIIPT